MVEALFHRIRALNKADTSADAWAAVFFDHFVNGEGDMQADDMLYFVKSEESRNAETADTAAQQQFTDKISSLWNQDTKKVDPIFLVRKTTNTELPPFADPCIDWRETVYLNMLVQCHYVLTCSIYEKQPHQKSHKLQTQVAKRVYAAPSSRRLDIKGSEYKTSYPLLYFSFEDFEEAFSDMKVAQYGAFDVELALQLPPPPPHTPTQPQHQQEPFSAACTTTDHSPEMVSGGETPTATTTQGSPVVPPTSPTLKTSKTKKNKYKIIIFSGSVSFDRLSTVFQKHQKNDFLNLVKQRKKAEYINMRGPKGKGHAQVAVFDESKDEPRTDSSNNISTDSPQQNDTVVPPGFNSFLKSVNAGLSSIKKSMDGERKPPEILTACLTFVNAPWQSVVDDVCAYFEKQAVEQAAAAKAQQADTSEPQN